MPVSSIVLAAGKGSRFSPGVSKPLVRINRKPLINYSLDVLQRHSGIAEIIVVANRKNRKAIAGILQNRRFSKASKIVLGGARRQDSVRKGLQAVAPGSAFVLIHDAARPFIDGKIVSAVLKEGRRSRAAIAGVPVKATIKKIAGSKVKTTVDRRDLWEIQTPQVFETGALRAAYRKFGKCDVTDDAMLVEKCGIRPAVVSGSYYNIKVTTPEDLLLAKAIARARR